jgi:hypothetical protein
MNREEEVQRAMQEILSQPGGRITHLFRQLHYLALSGQPTDITVFNGSPHLDVKVDPKFTYALMYGAGPEKLGELLSAIELSNGKRVSIKEIWTINPMPESGIPQDELDAVDLQEAEEKVGPNGETLRKMISETYQCKTREQEDKFLRRYIAS